MHTIKQRIGMVEFTCKTEKRPYYHHARMSKEHNNLPRTGYLLCRYYSVAELKELTRGYPFGVETIYRYPLMKDGNGEDCYYSPWPCCHRKTTIYQSREQARKRMNTFIHTHHVWKILYHLVNDEVTVIEWVKKNP